MAMCRFLLTITLVLIASILTLCETARSQIQNSKAFSKSEFLTVEFDSTGVPNFTKGGKVSVQFGEFADLLNQKEIQLEIDLSNSQIEDLERISREARRESDEISRQLSIGELSAAESTTKYDLLYDQTHAKSMDVLVPLQYERLQQVASRIRMREIGLESWIDQNKSDLGLSIDNTVSMKIDRALEHFRTRHNPRLQKYCDRLLDELLQPLTDSQNEQLSTTGVRLSPMYTFPDIFMAQLIYAREMESDFRQSADSLRDLTKYVAFAPRFRTMPDGHFAGYPSGEKGFWYNELMSIDLHGLPISVEDRNIIDANARNKRNEYATESANVYREAQSIADPEERNSVISKRMKELRQSLFDWEDQILEDLSPEGKSAFLDYYRRKSRFQYGLIAALVHGPLGTEVKLTDAQRNEIKKRLKVAVEKLTDDFRVVESEFLIDFFKAVGPENTKKIQETLGPPMQHVKPVMLAYLSSDNK